MKQNKMEIHQNSAEPWRVALVDTGDEKMTSGRLKRVRNHIGENVFFFTHGDGIANVDISSYLLSHKQPDVIIHLAWGSVPILQQC